MRIIRAGCLLAAVIGIASANAQEYRFRKDGVALESAENRGLSFDDVAVAAPLVPPRPRPMPEFSPTGRKQQQGSIDKRRIEAALTESRSAQVETGFPFPKGGIFNPQHIRVLDANEEEIPAQVRATAFWPDDSIKWALLQFSAKDKFSVEFGNAVRRQESASPLSLSREGDIVTIHTGAIQAKVNAGRFNLIQEVTSATSKPLGSFSPEGVRLVATDGSVYSASRVPPEKFDIEQEGPEKIVLRAEGSYANSAGEKFMCYVTRLTFRRDSARVEITHTHINDALAHEFTDFQSLEMPFEIAAKTDGGRLLLPDGKETATAKTIRVFQEDESRSVLTEGDQSRQSGRSPGALEARSGEGRIAAAVQDFRERWPKALGLKGNQIAIDLLPKLPDAAYGSKLPAHLMYPFVNGNYRMKWGMAFTERVTLDFGDSASLAELADAVNKPPIAIIPSSWHEETGALGLMAAKNGNEFAEWDDFFERGYQAQMRRREQNREYGFMNYGDWFGERGRNWGNNEYDIAHTFFMQFARTGKPEYYRLALAAARHQADSDIVHAYPDPAYVGANPQHSIGHTGMWTQMAEYAAWSYKYDGHADATNGHTWAEGMTEAWFLAGEATVMESTLLLGEHIAWAVAPTFQISVSYPRSAGWSLRAIIAIYRATADPEYLKAADSIARSAIVAQDESGIWVRNYAPRSHSGSTAAVIPEEESGISNFQLGLTLAGLAQYYDVTKSTEARDAVLRGARLLAKAWPGSGGWPYDIRKDGTPSPARPKQTQEANILNAESIAYMGMQENDSELLRVAEEVLLNTLFYQEPVATRQKIGLMLRSGAPLLGALHAAYQKNGGQWPGLAVEDRPDSFFKGIFEARKFDVRGPGTLAFLIKTRGEPTTLRLFRADSNAFKSGERKGKIRLRKPDGALLQEQEIVIAGARQEFPLEVPEAPNGVFLLEIEEPERGIWNLDPAPLAGVLMKTGPRLLLAGIGIARYSLAIPEDAETVTITVTGTHPGAYGAALLDEDGRSLGFYRGVVGKTGTGRLTVTLKPEHRGKILPLVLWAAGDLQLEAEGAPLWLARNAAEYFRP